MFLENTEPQISDTKAFIEMSLDEDIRNEFPELRFENIAHAEEFVQFRIDNRSTNDFLQMIRIAFREGIDVYTSENSITIGFISLHTVSHIEWMATGGFEQNVSFAIFQKYRNKGLMTQALNMLLDAMIEHGYNVLPSLAKNPASERVLTKCGFRKINDTPFGVFYVKKLCMDEEKFNQTFFIK